MCNVYLPYRYLTAGMKAVSDYFTIGMKNVSYPGMWNCWLGDCLECEVYYRSYRVMHYGSYHIIVHTVWCIIVHTTFFGCEWSWRLFCVSLCTQSSSLVSISGGQKSFKLCILFIHVRRWVDVLLIVVINLLRGCQWPAVVLHLGPELTSLTPCWMIPALRQMVDLLAFRSGQAKKSSA